MKSKAHNPCGKSVGIMFKQTNFNNSQYQLDLWQFK